MECVHLTWHGHLPGWLGARAKHLLFSPACTAAHNRILSCQLGLQERLLSRQMANLEGNDFFVSH